MLATLSHRLFRRRVCVSFSWTRLARGEQDRSHHLMTNLCQGKVSVVRIGYYERLLTSLLRVIVAFYGRKRTFAGLRIFGDRHFSL